LRIFALEGGFHAWTRIPTFLRRVRKPVFAMQEMGILGLNALIARFASFGLFIYKGFSRVLGYLGSNPKLVPLPNRRRRYR
jgi:hypothetical protein